MILEILGRSCLWDISLLDITPLVSHKLLIRLCYSFYSERFDISSIMNSKVKLSPITHSYYWPFTHLLPSPPAPGGRLPNRKRRGRSSDLLGVKKTLLGFSLETSTAEDFIVPFREWSQNFTSRRY